MILVFPFMALGYGMLAKYPINIIRLRHYMERQIMGALDGLMGTEPAVAIRESIYPEQAGVAPPHWRRNRGGR